MARSATRREFLATAAACAAACTIGEQEQDGPPDAMPPDAMPPPDAAPPPDLASPDLYAPPQDPLLTPASDAFSLGVASGDATVDGALLWTRYGGALPLLLVVYEVQDGRYVREAVAQPAEPADGGFTHVPVTGLPPGGEYAYVFFEAPPEGRVGRSPIGRFRTAPAPGDLVPISFGATCCSKAGLPLDTIAHAGGRGDLSFFCLLGDNIYADPSVTVAEYRQKYAENLGSAAYLKLREAMSLIATWDDHEVVNDWDPEKISQAQRDAALQTFFEALPIRRSMEDPGRIYRSLRHGRTLEVFVLDCHGERRPSTRKTAAAQYLSPAQMAWLKDGLSRSEAVFKVILNSTPITLFPGETDPALSWGGYKAQRTEILSYIDQQEIRGVLWLSGDYHFPCVGRVSASGPGSTALEALTGPANQTPSGRGRTFGPPQIDWASDVNNYLAVHLDPAGGTARLVFHDGSGAVLLDRTYPL